ncbi:MAG TPA: hypothetical protein VF466_04385 [Candidatus Saccharimonadales bacterium]
MRFLPFGERAPRDPWDLFAYRAGKFVDAARDASDKGYSGFRRATTDTRLSRMMDAAAAVLPDEPLVQRWQEGGAVGLWAAYDIARLAAPDRDAEFTGLPVIPDEFANLPVMPNPPNGEGI